MRPVDVYILLILCAAFAGEAEAEIYTWLDTNGVRHYSDIFPGRGENIVDLEAYDTEAPPPPKQPETERAPAHADTAVQSSKSVLMYVEPNCPECDQARAFFQSNGVKLFEMDISNNKAAEAAFKRIGGETPPLIVIGETRIHGFDRAAIIKALLSD